MSGAATRQLVAVVSNLRAIGRKMEVWRGRAAAEGASLLVWGLELVERGEK